MKQITNVTEEESREAKNKSKYEKVQNVVTLRKPKSKYNHKMFVNKQGRGRRVFGCLSGVGILGQEFVQ